MKISFVIWQEPFPRYDFNDMMTETWVFKHLFYEIELPVNIPKATIHRD